MVPITAWFALLALAAGDRFEVVVAPEASGGAPLTGHLVLVVAKSGEPEPRLLISPSGPALFGVDLVALEPGATAVVDDATLGHPLPLAELAAGDYFVQALVNVYEEVKRADGRVLWLPMNDGHQEPFQVSPGNLVSDVQKVRLGDGATHRVEVARVLPPIERPADSEWVKRVSIPSAKLTEFWGRPIAIHATVLLPKGFADDPAATFPCLYAFGHRVPFNFTTTPPRSGTPGAINPVSGTESGHDFHLAWLSDDFPRLVAISFEQQTPFFPDSYSTNSAANGPYGDALLEEVIPELERRFRLVAQPWARHVEGASTGGWQALALQLRHPDLFGGAWVLQPDPVDFRRYLLVDLERDLNAFEVATGPFTTAERPFRRTVEGQVVWTMRELSRFEEVLGTRGRSGYQLAGWEAVFGPLDADGYPRPLWDKLTGTIDRETLAAMRANDCDLREFLERNWAKLGPKLAGKLHFACGDMDDFHLDAALGRLEEFLKNAKEPPSDATFTWGRPRKGHSWHAEPWADFVRRVAADMRRAAAVTPPAGAR